jgi:hypothetical protein
MGLFNSIFGTASTIDPNDLRQEFRPVLTQGEQITAAFKVVRDLYVFTQWRLIFTDKQGLTGKKVEYHSIPYKSISQFSVETAGHFDADAELKIYISGNPNPIKKEFRGRTDIVQIQQMLATYVLAPHSSNTSDHAPVPVAAPPVRFFLYTKDGVTGPHEMSVLMAMWSAGQIDAGTTCCLEGSEEWQDCGTVLGKSGGAAS